MQADYSDPILDQPIDKIGLRKITSKSLMENGIFKVGDCLGRSRIQLLRMPNVDTNSLNDILLHLSKFNFIKGRFEPE